MQESCIRLGAKMGVARMTSKIIVIFLTWITYCIEMAITAVIFIALVNLIDYILEPYTAFLKFSNIALALACSFYAFIRVQHYTLVALRAFSRWLERG